MWPWHALDSGVGARSGSTTWWLYVLLARNGRRTYVGISPEPARRLEQHNGQRPGGARATRGGRPWSMGRVYGPYDDRAEASRAEYWLKKKRGQDRLRWDGVYAGSGSGSG